MPAGATRCGNDSAKARAYLLTGGKSPILDSKITANSECSLESAQLIGFERPIPNPFGVAEAEDPLSNAGKIGWVGLFV